MRSLALAAGLLAALPALSQEPVKPEAKPRPALNLRLDETRSAAPRITFGQGAAAQTAEEREKGLPELGGKTSPQFTRPINPNSSGSPIPKSFDPAGGSGN